MAATVSSPWNKPGAWALDSEQHEEELKQQLPASPAADFPSLTSAVTNKPSKKKSKGQPMSLSDFVGYKAPSTREEAPLVLPTAPRERTQEELEESRRRGFRTFSDNRDNSRSRPPREDRDIGPSRADEADDWSKMKKAPSSFDSGRDREIDGPSRADEVDDWSKGKRFVGGGGGDRTDRRERVGFFNSNRADEVDNWAANKSSSFAPPEQRRERRVGFDATGPASDLDNWSKNKVVDNESGSGRPRLNLQPRTLPVEKIVVKSDVSVPNEVEKEAAFVVTERKPKENPFGAARPREEVLKEKGQDWKEIDDKLEAVKIKEAEKTNSEGFDGGRRRGFGLGSGEERSVRTWRKPDSPNGRPVAEAPTPAPAALLATPIFGSFVEATVKSSESIEKAREDN